MTPTVVLVLGLAFVVGFGLQWVLDRWLRVRPGRARFAMPAPFNPQVFAIVRHGYLTILGGAPSPRDKFVIDSATSDWNHDEPIVLTILDRSTHARLKVVFFFEDLDGQIRPCADDRPPPPLGAEHELSISPAKGVTLVGHFV